MPRPTRAPDADLEPAAEPTEAPVENDESGESAEIGAAFADLAKLFQAGPVKRAEAKKALDTGLSAINKALADNPDLAKDPAVWAVFEKIEEAQRTQSTELPPGTIRKLNEFVSDKVDWQWRHLHEPPPEYRPGGAKYADLKAGRCSLPPNTVEWAYGMIPLEKEEVIYNGLKVIFFPEVPYTGPKCFWDIYMDARRGRRVAQQHQDYMLNGGNLPEDPTVVSVVSQAVRASGHRIPGMPPGYSPGRGTSGMTRIEGGDAPEGGEAA